MRLGDLDALEAEIRENIRRYYSMENEVRSGYCTAQDAADEVKNAPTIDAVLVVRCEDCKYQEDCFSQIGHWSRDHILEQNNYEYHKIGFCSYGKKKDGNG